MDIPPDARDEPTHRGPVPGADQIESLGYVYSTDVYKQPNLILRTLNFPPTLGQKLLRLLTKNRYYRDSDQYRLPDLTPPSPGPGPYRGSRSHPPPCRHTRFRTSDDVSDRLSWSSTPTPRRPLSDFSSKSVRNLSIRVQGLRCVSRHPSGPPTIISTRNISVS